MDRKRYFRIAVSSFIIILGACDRSDRIMKLEKDNTELRSEIDEKIKAANNYDLEEKCSRDAREWREEWLREHWDRKYTMFTSYTSHYNATRNTCFIIVERHLKTLFGESGSWSNVIEFWDVLENDKYAAIQEDHLVHSKPHFNVGDDIVQCKVAGKECKSLEELNNLARPYMSE